MSRALVTRRRHVLLSFTSTATLVSGSYPLPNVSFHFFHSPRSSSITTFLSTPLLHSVRQLILSTISCSEELKQTALVFTDQQSSSPLGSSVAREYEMAAQQRHCQFLSVRIECKEDEYLRRALSDGRKKSLTSKLTEESIIKRMRETEDVFKFGGENDY